MTVTPETRTAGYYWIVTPDQRIRSGHLNRPVARELMRLPIEQYREAIPQKWWQKLLRHPVQYRLRIRRAFPQSINCRCVII